MSGIDFDRLTGDDTYFEDFPVGRKIRHARGKTVTEVETVLMTNMAMNTAQDHFNAHVMEGGRFPERITFGGVTAALVLGLASQDTAENALEERGLTAMRLPNPVFHGDTLYAFSEVLEAAPEEGGEGAGRLRFKHWGLNQRGETVFEAERTVLLKRRPA
jgi:acyl dehydratase